MDLRKIKKLIEMLEESGLSEIEIKEGEESVRLVRVLTAPSYPSAQVYSTPQPIQGHVVTASAPASAAIIKPADSHARDLPEGNVVRAPMVGSYYTSQAPGQPALAKLGQQVKMGDTIGIIEAMKMFNPIQSEFSGTVVKILVENGSPVEFDQALMVIA